mmetsp:Transcript_1103/g.2182  ORF Transcript_1103/g.2182 Transcript_1103/m.2182 type:complete len:278 (+) Transcript_1103:1674-2507(+)
MRKCLETYRKNLLKKVFDHHCNRKHRGMVPHHYVTAKISSSVWAWEMTIRYVAQVLLQETLLRIGLDKAVFQTLVEELDEGPAKGEIIAVIGGGIPDDHEGTRTRFKDRLIGKTYNCLYLPSVVKRDDLAGLSSKVLLDKRNQAIKVLLDKAGRWLKCLLREIQLFDLTTLVTAFGNEKGIAPTEIAGYLWNAFGLFFQRGLLDSECMDSKCDFPPAAISLSMKQELSYSMWDAFHHDSSGPFPKLAPSGGGRHKSPGNLEIGKPKPTGRRADKAEV